MWGASTAVLADFTGHLRPATRGTAGTNRPLWTRERTTHMNGILTAFRGLGGGTGQGQVPGQGWGGQVPGQGQIPGGGYGRGFGHGFGRGFGGPGGFGHHAMGPFGAIGGIFMLLVTIGVIAVVVFAFWELFKKAGYPGAYGLLMLIPLVNIGVVLFLAFSDWPVLRELRAARGAATPVPDVVAPAAEPVAEAAPPPAAVATEPLPVVVTEPEPVPSAEEPPKDESKA